MARKRMILPLVAIGIYALSWFLPVHRAGTRIGTHELPGWQAFRLALFEMWPRRNIRLTELIVGLLGPASALTNFFFLAAAFLLLRRPGASSPVVKWGLVASVTLNLWWFAFGMDIGDLRSGYYLWVASFAMLAVAALRQEPTHEPASPAAGDPA